MAVKIRLRRMGTKKVPFYRVVVADERAARDGRFLESLGTYDPVRESGGLKIDAEKAVRWLQKGAQPTETVRSLLRGAGVMRQSAESRAKKPAAS
jgi:small subunit ribosomal protein S16